ncbi:MAG: sel1 repeat family protein [Alphaproteobacteria bacterium]|nr:sel1 repeat family protein [Alphaproteobacteria bacterium]
MMRRPLAAACMILLAPLAALAQQAPVAKPAQPGPAAPIFTLPGVAGMGVPTAPPSASSEAEPAIRDWRHSKTPPDLAFGAYQLGLFVTANREATRRLQTNPNDAAAMTLLGEIYRDGLGVKPDAAAAARWFQQAATRGDRQAAFALARIYLEGAGTPKDMTQARKYLEQAAATGHGPALYNLGVMEVEAEIRDYKKAADLFRRAMDNGDIDGAYSLAYLYREGLGVEKDLTRAAAILKFAADRHHIAAEVEFAIALFNGAGVDRDEAAAARYFERAAWRNAPVAQNGRGVKQDDVEAMKWHIIARSNGVKDDWLEDRLPRLTKTQRALVEEAVRRFANR